MKNYLLLFLLLFLINNSFVKAQTNYTWEPIGLTVSGNNTYQGVESYYRVAECDGEYYLILKFINHNNTRVLLEWEDGIFSQSHEWMSNSTNNNIKTITIMPESEISCDCNQPIDELFVNIREFVPNFEDFLKYRAISLKITLIEE